MLGNSSNGRGVVRRSVDRSEAVVARWDTRGNGCRDDTIVICWGIDTLEEGERGRIEDRWIIESAHRLNDKVSVTDEDLLAVELLRRHVVCLLCICENTGLHVVQDHFDGEGLVGRDGRKVDGVLELALGHVGLWDNVTHWDGITRAGSDLLTIGDCLSSAEVDKVV